MSPPDKRPSQRLNKYISDSGICSRREADRFIEQGAVTINGRRATIGDRVRPGARVSVNGQEIEPRDGEDFIVIALNKPVGIVSTTESSERDNVVKFVGHPQRIFPIGRLDKDSQGLLLLTNNGDIVNKILRAGNNHDKEYVVTVDKPVTDAFIEGMAGGVPILGTRTKKCTVERVASHVFRVVLVQGLNRQIRRMCEHFGYRVNKLERTKIMNITLAGLPVGDWRDLTPAELDELGKLIAHSSGEAKPGSKRQTSKPAGHGKSAHKKSSQRGSKTGGAKKSGERGAKSAAGGGRTGRPKNAGPKRAKSSKGRPASKQSKRGGGNKQRRR